MVSYHQNKAIYGISLIKIGVERFNGANVDIVKPTTQPKILLAAIKRKGLQLTLYIRQNRNFNGRYHVSWHY